MADRPLLLLPNPSTADRAKRGGGPGRFVSPGGKRQVVRLAPKFARLELQFAEERQRAQLTATGLEPEKALVLQTVGSVDRFARAVSKIAGLEWMAELAAEFDPDDDFYRLPDASVDLDGEASDAKLDGRIYLIMTDQRGIDELLSLWKRYKRDPKAPFPRGLAPWRNAFGHLRDLRTWGTRDRLAETGVEDFWRESVAAGERAIKFEVELWPRRSAAKREESLEGLRRLLKSAGGSILRSVQLDSIAYVGALVSLPSAAVRLLLSDPDSGLLSYDQVMFYRAHGQAVSHRPGEVEFALHDGVPQDAPRRGDPVIGLLDGMPLTQHRLLGDRLVVDDPDNLESAYEAADRIHGTEMASLILHGDLGERAPPLSRPIYVRPIMEPDKEAKQFDPDLRVETTPPDELVVDLVHRAVRRMILPNNSEPAAAPSVRIINISVCDRRRLFEGAISPWARLIDWLSAEHDRLFIVSAGNHADPIDASQDLKAVDDPLERERFILQHLESRSWERRLRPPAESINAVTVGGIHHDFAPLGPTGRTIEPYATPRMPSIFNPIARGLRGAVKPEVLLSGGRQLLVKVSPIGGALSFQWNGRAPGHQVASPGSKAGDLSSTTYTRGTSNACALASRACGIIFDSLGDLASQPGGDRLTDRAKTVLTKALLVHTAEWEAVVAGKLRSILGDDADPRRMRATLARHLGYGVCSPERALACSPSRATLIGVGELGADEGHEYEIPLPSSLSGQRIARRVSLTLAWFSPVNPWDRRYRQADMWLTIDDLANKLRLRTRDVEKPASERGTVQHLVLLGEDAIGIAPDAKARLLVSCREDAPGLERPVPYALAVTIEVAEATGLPVYDEIRSAMRVGVRPRRS